MKSLSEKKDPNLAEKLKGYKELVNVSKSALETNAKNTKEYFDTLQKLLETNQNLTKDYRQYAEKELDFYMKAMDTATTDEERKELFLKVEQLNEDINKFIEDTKSKNKEIEEKAETEAVENKNYALTILKGLGIGLGIITGAIVLKNSPDIIKKLTDKK